MKRTPFLVASLLLLALNANAQQATSSPQTEEPAQGSITGKVVSEAGQPLSGATVYLRPMSPTGTSRTAIADLEGNFQLNNLDAALYIVSATSPAYTSPPQGPDVPPNFSRLGDNVRLELVRGGVITGTVTNSAGEPVVGVSVRAQMIRDHNGERATFRPGGERPTDDRGIYRIYGLPPGTYLVAAGGTMSQSFMNGPYDIDAPTYAPSATRDNASEVTVRSGEEANIEIRYRGEQGRRISGTIKNQGMTGASVSLSLVGTGSISFNSSYVAPDGRGFAFFGVPDGDYEIVAQQILTPVTGLVSPELARSEPLRVNVRGADVSGIELVTQPLAQVSGVITLESSKAPECQNKRRPVFSETLVEITRNIKVPKEDPNSALSPYVGLNQPDKDWKFNSRNMRQGQYTFSPKFFARYWYVQSISIAGPAKAPVKGEAVPVKTDAIRNWVTIKSGDRINSLTIALAEGAASIRGQINLPAGSKPDESLKVFVVPAEREKSDDVLRFAVATTSPDGTFSLNNLAPGRYLILAQPNNDAELSSEKIRLPNALESRTRLRKAAEASKNELELKPCQSLTDYKVKLSQ